MTDREMLELAAKAAGYTSHGFAEMVCGSPCLFLREADFTGMWAPLTDDGDALRLAVKLRLSIYTPEEEGDGATISIPGVDGGWITEECTVDASAATRRAIVRAAAEIGKATP